MELTYQKIVVIPIGELLELHHLAQFFGCGVQYLPSSFLGCSLVLRTNAKVRGNNCGRVLQETSYISKGGGVTYRSFGNLF